MVRYCDPRHTLSSQVQAFGHLFRWPVGLFAGLAGCATFYSLDFSTPFASYVLTTVVLSCMYSASCAINDYWDVEQDRINHPDRPLPSGRLTQSQACLGATSLFAVAAIATLLLGFMPLLWVVVAIPRLWYCSQIVKYSGIFGNAIVAIFVASSDCICRIGGAPTIGFACSDGFVVDLPMGQGNNLGRPLCNWRRCSRYYDHFHSVGRPNGASDRVGSDCGIVGVCPYCYGRGADGASGMVYQFYNSDDS
ncbi:MAG: UbiA family prenyltransferase [Cyanobacteria bacterium P01_E01_bin.34]